MSKEKFIPLNLAIDLDKASNFRLTQLFKFQTFDDYLFNRIIYIRGVLDNPNHYTDIPSRNDLICELWRLLGDYQAIVGKMFIDNEEEE